MLGPQNSPTGKCLSGRSTTRPYGAMRREVLTPDIERQHPRGDASAERFNDPASRSAHSRRQTAMATITRPAAMGRRFAEGSAVGAALGGATGRAGGRGGALI